MTHFEEAKQSPASMAIMIGFCIATFVEQSGYKFKDKEMTTFILENSMAIEEWLNEESQVEETQRSLSLKR